MWGEKLKQRLQKDRYVGGLENCNRTLAACFIKIYKLVILYNNFLILFIIPAFVHLGQIFLNFHADSITCSSIT